MGLHGIVPFEDLSWSFLRSRRVTVLSCVKVIEDFSKNSSRFLSACFWPFKFDALKYVLLSLVFFPTTGMQYDTMYHFWLEQCP